MNDRFLDKLTREKLLKEISILDNKSLLVNTDKSAVSGGNNDLIGIDQFVPNAPLNPSFVFVTVILTCFLILIFSIGLIVVFKTLIIRISFFLLIIIFFKIAQMKRKQDKDQRKMNEIYGQRIYDNIERIKPPQNEFVGYFLPNYASTSQMNLISY